MVWPSTISLFYAMFDLPFINKRTVYVYTYPAVGVVVWLLTRHNVDDTWKNVLLLMPSEFSLPSAGPFWCVPSPWKCSYLLFQSTLPPKSSGSSFLAFASPMRK
ncbi:hypothetical protein C7M84_022487 [Penaeus vannamei]|uniref:Uncharacterized protein n=1 Tax=Penaeus vannamei TaxID=6689 RepID=A0A3R7QN07_PENVA|nr:hypothetical protein C7M84_022487 [Penaeus vannamei]